MTETDVFVPFWERDREKLFSRVDFSNIKTPAYVIHLGALEENLKILKGVKDATGCKILLALKAFSGWKTAPLVMQYLDGVCASSVHEARTSLPLIRIGRFGEYGNEAEISQWRNAQEYQRS